MIKDKVKDDSADAPVLQETLDRLVGIIYSSYRCTDPDLMLSAARRILGRPGLKHGMLESLTEPEAQRLIQALDEAYPDRRQSMVERAKKHIVRRIS
ncbi:hypothetical protein AMJ57_00055 [Parcubacteria bacterium SG8_24]|nr:MAG: hypothetical protein AMJ57_00055 [Parcubacteria bacterium SG8_24]